MSGSGRATTGRIEVTRTNGSQLETIDVRIDPSIPGVRITFDDGVNVVGPLDYDWETLEGLFGSGAQERPVKLWIKRICGAAPKNTIARPM